MSIIKGLTGLRPAAEAIEQITVPPYDVIKPGSILESCLQNRPDSLSHITLGNKPLEALERLLAAGRLQPDEKPCFYVYEQKYGEEIRTGILTAARVSDYKEGKIIRHEKTFDDKVRGRLELRKETNYTFEPVFLLTKAAVGVLLEKIKAAYPPEYTFTSDFQGASELHGIRNRIFRIPEDSREGQLLKSTVDEGPLYIADGHHRYHASLLNRQSHCLAYVCEAKAAKIQAYNRVINGLVPFSQVLPELKLRETDKFMTPPKHHFAIYSKSGNYLLQAGRIPADDLVGRLDCSILEKELYPLLGLNHEMITDHRCFDYYPESDLEKMCQEVDEGRYDLAVALHPVSTEELLEVAQAGITNPDIVMPEKSTFFAPKILSGIFIYKHISVKI